VGKSLVIIKLACETSALYKERQSINPVSKNTPSQAPKVRGQEKGPKAQWGPNKGFLENVVRRDMHTGGYDLA